MTLAHGAPYSESESIPDRAVKALAILLGRSCQTIEHPTLLSFRLPITASLATPVMFITFPPYEFRMPTGLVVPDARHWRMMQVNLHAPWFLLAVEVLDIESDTTFVQTICFAWESDLVDFLPSVDPKAVRGLVCMAPGWKSSTGTWTSHDVRQVWLIHTEGGRYLGLNGADGHALDVGLSSDSVEEATNKTLLLEVKPRRRVLRSSKRKAAGMRRAS